MAFTERYLNYDLSSGNNDGTSEADAWQDFAACLSGVAAGDRVNVKRTSSRASTGNITWGVSGTATAPIHIRGYTSTIGDGGMFEMTQRFIVNGEHVVVEGLDIENGGWTLGLWLSGDYTVAYRCKVTSTSTSGSIARCHDGAFINVHVAAPINSNFIVEALRATLVGCYFHANGGTTTSGARILSLNASHITNNVIDCVFKGNGDSDLIGIEMTGDNNKIGGAIMNNTIENCGIGLQLKEGQDASGVGITVIQDNIVYNGVKGFENLQGTNTSTAGLFLNNNATGSLSGAAYTNMGDVNYNAITLSASPFVDTTDYELNSTSGGGALLRQRGALKSLSDPSVVSPTSSSRKTFPDVGPMVRPTPETSHVF